MRAAALAPLAALLLLGGCRSQWYPGVAHHDIVRTNVLIRTEPPGARIRFNGKEMSAPSPIRVPVDYDHYETMYERQTNAGADMREGQSTLTQVVTAPVWLAASAVHHGEEVRRHEYAGNQHEISAWLPGYEEAVVTVTLEGEAEHPVTLKLERTK